MRISEYLAIGKLDGAVSFPKFPEFDTFLYFVRKPIFVGQPVFVFKKEFPLDIIKSIEDIKGLRIGVVNSKSNRYIPFIDENRNKLILEKFADLNWAEHSIKLLMNDHLDAILGRQQYTIPYVAHLLKLTEKIKIINAPAPPTPFYIVFSKNVDQNESVLKKINQIVSNENPDFKKILDTQFQNN